MSENAEVKVKLTVDTNSQKVTSQLQHDLEKTQGVATTAGKAAGGGLAQGVSSGAVMMGNIYAQVMSAAFHATLGFAKDALHAFQESAAQVKQLASTFAVVDRGGASFGALKAYASSAKDELEGLGMRVGVLDDDLVEVFDNIISKGRLSYDQSMELTESFAYAGRAIPGGAKALSEAFEAVQMGVIRARNPIVGMIAASGLLKGNAKQVAAELQKMGIDKQMEIAEKAVTMMANKMQKVPMSFGEAKNSLEVLRQNMMESMGESLMKGLSNTVKDFRAMWLDSKGNATELTRSVGEGMHWAGEQLALSFELAKPTVEGFVQGVLFMSEGTKLIWEEIFGRGENRMAAMKVIAQSIGIALGAVVAGIGAGIGVIVLASQAIVKYLTLAVGVFVRGAGETLKLLGRGISMIPGQEETGAAYQRGGEAVAGYGADVMKMGRGGEQSDLLARVKVARSDEEMNKLEAQYRELAHQVSNSTAEYYEYMSQFTAAARVHADMMAQESAAQQYAAGGTERDAIMYLKAYEAAQAIHDEAAAAHIVSFLGQNEKMATAIGQLAPDIIQGGVRNFVDALRAAGNVSAAETIEKGQKPKLGAQGGGNVVMNGGQTFNLKQDFRDQDPDRVATVFRKDVARMAASRIQSRVAGVHGF